MKTLIASLFCLIATNVALAQWEEFYGAGVIGDTVKIWNPNIYTSCGAKYVAFVSLSKDSIVLTERDTSTRHMLCGCYYDVNVSLTGLLPATYQIVIYREQLKKYQYSFDTLMLKASFSLSVGGAGELSQSTKIQASDCHQTPISSVDESAIIHGYALLTSFPNPFNPKATIQFSLPNAENVDLDVYDSMGRIVATLVNGKTAAGHHAVELDGSRLASGIYVCRLVAGPIILTYKLVLLK